MGDIAHETPAKIVTCEETKVTSGYQSRSKSWRRRMTSRLTDSLHHKGLARIIAKVNYKAQDKTYRWHLFRSCIYRIDIGTAHFRLRTTASRQAILTTLGILMIFNVNTSRWSVTSGPRLHATSNILQGEVCVGDGRRVREQTGYDRLVDTTGEQTLETPDYRSLY